MEPLTQALRFANSTVRLRAARALDELGWKPRDATEKAQYLLAKSEWNALLKLGEVAVDILLQALRDVDRTVRWAAVEALGKLGDARAIAPLTKALQNEEYLVQKAIKKALAKLQAQINED